jgi:hypothetical protein
VNVHRLMLIGVEEYDNSKIFKQFWHSGSAQTIFYQSGRNNWIFPSGAVLC